MPQPLLDHFRPPLSLRKGWKGFHSQWAGDIVDHLNLGVLPDRYESESEVHAGSEVAIDVATTEDWQTTNESRGGAATAVYSPPAPAVSAVVEFADPDLFEVKVYRDEGGLRLVAAIELVSESNKDRPRRRRTFATKVASYLSRGLSVVVVDIVTSRRANLHAELVGRMHLPDVFEWESPSGLSAVSYRAVQGSLRPDAEVADGNVRLEMWPHELRVGDPLPTVPLWLAADLAVPLDLDATYAAACRSLRLG